MDDAHGLHGTPVLSCHRGNVAEPCRPSLLYEARPHVVDDEHEVDIRVRLDLASRP